MVIEPSGVKFGLISKSNERAARVRFEITSMISDQNCTTQSSITTLLHPFTDHTNYCIAKIQDFSQCQYLVDPVGNKSCKIGQTMVFFAFHFPAI